MFPNGQNYSKASRNSGQANEQWVTLTPHPLRNVVLLPMLLHDLEDRFVISPLYVYFSLDALQNSMNTDQKGSYILGGNPAGQERVSDLDGAQVNRA